jgi:outer membrane receptor protein involved in Fe transport
MRRAGRAAVLLFLALWPAPAAASESGVVGWVRDTRGVPVEGALVSLFANAERGAFVTLSDSSGRFQLPALPPGSYTLRALGGDRAASRRITVLPNQDSIFTLNLSAALSNVDADAALEKGSPAERELRWLLRHKRRSVLEARGPVAPPQGQAAPTPASLLADLMPWIPELGGSFELSASPGLFGEDATDASDRTLPSAGALRLQGALPGAGRWNLGGLVADSASTSWRMGAEFDLQPWASHAVRAGGGYGRGLLQTSYGVSGSGQAENRSAGSLFVEDRWTPSGRFSATAGVRYSYVGFVSDPNQVSPSASLEWRAGSRTRLRAASSAQSVAPGGDLLRLSTLDTAPAMAMALVGPVARPERILRHELGLNQGLGASTSVGAFAFREGVRDSLVNIVEGTGPSSTLRVVNGSGVVVQAAGIAIEQRLGDLLSGSVTYTYGRSRPGQGPAGPGASFIELSEAEFHDVVTRLEAFIDRSDTRLVAYYRFNAWQPEGERYSQDTARFDFQLIQGIPFLSSMTRTDWELLLAFRNLFYEVSEGSIADELAVVNPPKRVVGGIAVRF